MTSKKSKASNRNAAKPAKPVNSRPDDFESISDDIDGFWDPDASSITVKPLYAKLSDSKQDTGKTSTLIFCELVTACSLTGRDGEPVKGEVGDLVGIWAKPGMRAIRNCCGVITYLVLTGEVDTGKQNMMKTFEVATKLKQKGTRIPIEEDNRRDSSQLSFLEDAPNRRESAPQSTPGRTAQPAAQPASDDDIPFS